MKMKKDYRISLFQLHKRVADNRAFTLIEVLVVVAIIAILVAVLLPSLQKARELSKIASCKANSKQIGMLTATYQSEFRGYVPVLFNYGIPERGYHPNDPLEHYAKHAFISVALRMYEKGLKNIESRISASDGTPFLVEPDPTNSATQAFARWQPDKRKEFERSMMPKHYACPFGRDDANADFHADMGSVRIGNTGPQYTVKSSNGVINAYGTWGWQGRIVRYEIPVVNDTPETYPGDPGGKVNKPTDGRPKYSILSWNFLKLAGGYYIDEYDPAGFIRGNAAKSREPAIYNKHRKWNTRELKRIKSTSFSDVTILYCMLGNFLSTNRHIHNPGSHRSSLGGGTVATFADTHVEWVKHTQIGWD